MIATTSAMLAGEVDLWMHDAHVPRQRIVAAEGLLLDAECAAHFLLARVVDGVLVARQVVGSREDGVARLAGGGVDALTLVWARLRIPLQERR